MRLPSTAIIIRCNILTSFSETYGDIHGLQLQRYAVDPMPRRPSFLRADSRYAAADGMYGAQPLAVGASDIVFMWRLSRTAISASYRRTDAETAIGSIFYLQPLRDLLLMEFCGVEPPPDGVSDTNFYGVRRGQPSWR